MANTATMFKIVVVLIYWSNLTHEQNDQDTVHGSRTHNESNMTCNFPAQHMTKRTTLTNYCLYTCCHKTDIPRSQSIIFKESKYNFGNAVIQEALSKRFSIPTSKEYICKKCDKHLLVEKMPTNNVASWMRLTSHKPQQKCIHCNSVPKDKALTFDKTKYGENTIVNQMTENDEQNIICNKCHNTILGESLVTCLTCDKTIKNVHFEIWYGKILLTGKQDTRNAKIKQNELLYMQELPLTTPTKMYMCVLHHRCA